MALLYALQLFFTHGAILSCCCRFFYITSEVLYIFTMTVSRVICRAVFPIAYLCLCGQNYIYRPTIFCRATFLQSLGGFLLYIYIA
jgi:hypothetical protein